MAKRKQTLEQVEASIGRWRTRAKRAMTMLDKLEKQRKRLAVRVSVPAHPTVDSETTLGTVPPPPAPPVAPPSRGAAVADLEIPGFLRRQDNTSPVADQIRQEQAETKKAKARGRIDKMKAKQRGDLKRMPLTGKAALAAIRG